MWKDGRDLEKETAHMGAGSHFVALLEGSLFSPSCFPYQIGARIKSQSPGSVKAE